jgi:hypothetical protein
MNIQLDSSSVLQAVFSQQHDCLGFISAGDIGMRRAGKIPLHLPQPSRPWGRGTRQIKTRSEAAQGAVCCKEARKVQMVLVL